MVNVCNCDNVVHNNSNPNWFNGQIEISRICNVKDKLEIHWLYGSDCLYNNDILLWLEGENELVNDNDGEEVSIGDGVGVQLLLLLLWLENCKALCNNSPISG